MNHLYRSRENRLIGGVAGGIAEYFNVDIAVVRLLWVLSVFFAGGGLLAYIIAWIIIPEQPVADIQAYGESAQQYEGYNTRPQKELSAEEKKAQDQRRSTAGLLLIGLGIIFLAHQLMPLEFSRFIWPLLLIFLGVVIFARGWKGDK